MGVNNSLLKSIQTIVDKAIEIAPFDKTRQAQIITNNGDGSYTIRLDGILYNNVPSYPKTDIIEVGTIVKVMTPGNQSSQMYIQSSKGGSGGGDHRELTRAEYEALTPEQKNDGTVYFVTDGDPDYFIMSDSVPIGAIQAFGGETAPEGWLICDGSVVSRETYSDLFKVIGTTYGSGDGSTTFNLPDLSGNVAIGASNNYVLGDVGGTEMHDHKYGIQYAGFYADTIFEGDNNTGVINYRTGNPSGGGINQQSIATSVNGNNTTSTKSGIAAHYRTEGYTATDSNMQPYIVTNYIIKALQPPTDNVIKNLDPQSLVLDAFYPIGSCYETSNTQFNPNIVWGGTWEKETKTDDYIVEQGTSGIWTYRKWASGIAELHGYYSANVAAKTINVSNYIQFPFTFTEKPVLTIGMYAGGAYFYDAWFENGSTNNSQIRLALYNNYTSQVSISVGIDATGFWKTYSAPDTKTLWHRTA